MLSLDLPGSNYLLAQKICLNLGGLTAEMVDRISPAIMGTKDLPMKLQAYDVKMEKIIKTLVKL